ncbi:putative dehydrogenase [Catalinimonas alkaloidigena]|uniref:Gfo/Idh/MocA family protein n=1 Tax=Catalinimonas alkaloidigena TaxID=1075417 RepID=UPI0024071311|nr:Gfo/Idh/MocA family oxidoreductase [Catalinimonas alkaloidigena]MDF9800599.1 putative dehydrogenase [Catalinimonas alkaloidigena]
MQKIKIGVAGLGFIGPAHIEALRRIPNLEVVAVSDFTLEIAQAKATSLGIAHAYGNFDELLNHEGIQAVHICTPNHLHYEMAKKTLEAGKHVVCEKPLATTVPQAEELVALAKSKGLVNAVHFNLRFYPLVKEMKAIRESGELGEVFSVIGTYLQDWLYYATDYNWRLEPEMSGDSRAIADIGSHLLDLVEYISGLEILEVMADFSTVHKTRKKPLKPVETYSGKMLKPEDYQDIPINTEDYATVMLRFNNGNRGVVTVSQVAAGRKNRINLEFSGSKQAMHWCSESPNELWIGKRDTANQSLLRDPALVHESAAQTISFPGGHNEGFPDTSKQMFKEVYAAIREGKHVEDKYATFAHGLRELSLCDAIVESDKKQAWVKL